MMWDGKIDPGKIRLRGEAYRRALADRVIPVVPEYVHEWRDDGSFASMDECGRLVPRIDRRPSGR